MLYRKGLEYCKWETDFYPVRVLGGNCVLSVWVPNLAEQKSHRKIAMTTVARKRARNHSAAEIAGLNFFTSPVAKKKITSR